MTSALERAQAAFARESWRDALSEFLAAEQDGSLDPRGHECLAVCAYMLGEDEVAGRAWTDAHRLAAAAGNVDAAARCAFWLALSLMLRGQMAQAGGWLARARQAIGEADAHCAAAGYVLIPPLLQALDEGDPDTALDLGVRMTELGDRFGDGDLRAFGILGQGQALIAAGDTTAGTARLDEVMVAVTAEELGPITSGIVYCAVILECMNLFDLRRAAEWTDALTSWCERQPGLVPFRGQCLVHRSQVAQAAGDWPSAIVTAEAACRRLTDPPHPALGLAHYQEAELHRLVGAFGDAESEYRKAARHGHDPMPGLALLELMRGDAATAAAAITRALEEATGTVARPPLLAAAADIHRALGDLVAARVAADELSTVAAGRSSPVLDAMAAHAMGSVLLAEGDPAPALAGLRAAAATWKAMRMPYEAARTGVLLALACAAIGDQTSAAVEFANASETFAELGAQPDLDRLTALTAGSGDDQGAGAASGPASELSPREREVLVHVAAGKTNREIAELLVISQHTVGRHVENIFTKLGVGSRAAATAYAYEHDLL